MSDWWSALNTRARASLVAAVILLVIATCAAAWWILRADRAVLFSDLRPQDAALMAAELDKLKVPYELADQGATVLVDRAQVHAIRLKLMGRELPLNGTVGLELFNHTDFGMTEFAQKVNYQRALQGELTRTILSFAEIRDVRVHLALPEQGLFKQNAARAKAAVTLAMRQGRTLRPDQVTGIQRLVAAAVPGLSAQEVTVVDQQGTALSRAADGEGEPGAGAGRLDLKRDMEAYLSRKASLVLEKAFGPGQALASVDVTLNMDQVRITMEDVIPAGDARTGPATGVLVRERESARDSTSPDARSTETRTARGSSMQRDAEYQAGRRVEQVVTQPGTIRRMQVVAVVRENLPPQTREQTQKLLAAAVGASIERGDTVVIQSLVPSTQPAREAGNVSAADATAPMVAAAVPSSLPVRKVTAFALLLIFICMLMLWRARRIPKGPIALTGAQREVALRRVQGWLLEPATPTASPVDTNVSRRGE